MIVGTIVRDGPETAVRELPGGANSTVRLAEATACYAIGDPAACRDGMVFGGPRLMEVQADERMVRLGLTGTETVQARLRLR